MINACLGYWNDRSWFWTKFLCWLICIGCWLPSSFGFMIVLFLNWESKLLVGCCKFIIWWWDWGTWFWWMIFCYELLKNACFPWIWLMGIMGTSCWLWLTWTFCPLNWMGWCWIKFISCCWRFTCSIGWLNCNGWFKWAKGVGVWFNKLIIVLSRWIECGAFCWIRLKEWFFSFLFRIVVNGCSCLTSVTFNVFCKFDCFCGVRRFWSKYELWFLKFERFTCSIRVGFRFLKSFEFSRFSLWFNYWFWVKSDG